MVSRVGRVAYCDRGAGGAERPRAQPKVVRGVVQEIALPLLPGSWGFNPRNIFEIANAKSCILTHFWMIIIAKLDMSLMYVIHKILTSIKAHVISYHVF